MLMPGVNTMEVLRNHIIAVFEWNARFAQYVYVRVYDATATLQHKSLVLALTGCRHSCSYVLSFFSGLGLRLLA